ncbi:MAG TPA: hypothetical protein VEQ41_07965 [Solirubrobacterales bacterium]|nr:hypothetical protein [Solirubrobacterales bacterium]
MVALLAFALLGATVVGIAGAETPASGPDPVVTRWAKWPYRVGCATLTFDPVRAFSRPTRAERGSGAAEAALRDFLVSADAAGIPRHDWRLLARTAERAEFGRGRLESDEGLSWLGLARTGAGWVVDGPWSCRPRTIRDGIPAADWVLPEAPLPDPSARSVVLGVHERACTGARDPVPHLMKPHIRYGEKAIVVTLWVRPPDGPNTCPGNPIGWLRLKLPGRLGNRALYDGGTYPPRPVQPGEDPRRLR